MRLIVSRSAFTFWLSLGLIYKVEGVGLEPTDFPIDTETKLALQDYFTTLHLNVEGANK